MKMGIESWAIVSVIITIMVIIFGIVITNTIATSDLPDWLKLMILL